MSSDESFASQLKPQFFQMKRHLVKPPVQVSKDSSAAFFSIFDLQAKRPRSFAALQLTKPHSSAEAALSGEDTTPSPAQIPQLPSLYETCFHHAFPNEALNGFHRVPLRKLTTLSPLTQHSTLDLTSIDLMAAWQLLASTWQQVPSLAQHHL